MPQTGAFDAVVIWYRLEALPGLCALVLAPGRAMTRYQYPSLVPNPVSVLAATAAGTFGLDWTQGREFGTGSWHDPVPIVEHRHRVVPPTGTK